MCPVYDAHPVRFPHSILRLLMSPSKDNLVADAKEIFNAAIDAVRPSRCFEGLSLTHLVVSAKEEETDSRQAPQKGLGAYDFETYDFEAYDLRAYDAIRIVAFGKAALGMAGAAEKRVEACGGTVAGGVAVVPPGYQDSLPGTERYPEHVQVLTGDHPIAGEASARAGRAVLRIVEHAGEKDLVLCLISGGGTSLVTLPVDELDVWDVRRTYALLLKSGADIHEMNAVRKHLTQIGGGQLAERAQAHVVSLIISDVPGDDLSVIASGPTVPDPSTFEDAVRVAYRHGVWSDLPERVRTRLAEGARGRRRETPGDASALRHPTWGNPVNHLLATNRTAQSAARQQATELGYDAVLPQSFLENPGGASDAEGDRHPSGQGGDLRSYMLAGEARETGARLARAWTGAQVDRRSCCVLGGETTVRVTGDGKGGRSQELALAAALEMDGGGGPVVVLAGGTDGVDGPTDAAGAWSDAETASRMRFAGMDPVDAMARNDSYAAHQVAGSLLVTGPTHTNVMDLVILLKS